MTEETQEPLAETLVEQAPEEAPEVVEAVEAETETDGESTTPEEKPKKQGGFQRKIAKLQEQNALMQSQAEEARREAEQARIEVEEFRRKQATQTHQLQMPTLEQYGHDEVAYQQAVVQWNQQGIAQEREALETDRKREKAQIDMEAKRANFLSRLSEAREQIPDFDKVVYNPAVPQLDKINKDAFEALIDSPKMGELAYFLAKNPTEIFEFSNMSPTQAIRQIGRLEARLENSPGPARVQPDPPLTVKSRSEPQVDPGSLSTEDWMAWRNEQLNR